MQIIRIIKIVLGFIMAYLAYPACASVSSCPYGIGVKYHPTTHIIEYVYPESPAEKAGVVEGDTLVSPLHPTSEGVEEIIIIRKGNTLKLKVKNECLKDLVTNTQWE